MKTWRALVAALLILGTTGARAEVSEHAAPELVHREPRRVDNDRGSTAQRGEQSALGANAVEHGGSSCFVTRIAHRAQRMGAACAGLTVCWPACVAHADTAIERLIGD